MSDFINKLREIRKDIWVNKPREIDDVLDKSKGYTDTWDSSFFPTLYCWEETVASRNAFLTLRQTLLKDQADLASIKALTKNFLDLYVSYFRMTNLQDTTALLREASAAVEKLETREDLQEFLEELVRYTGRMHYWIEPIMPWEPIIEVFEKATK